MMPDSALSAHAAA